MSPSRAGANVGTGLGGVTGWHICDGSRQQADRLLIRSTRWARPGSAAPGTGQKKGTPNRGQIRSESPGTADTDPGGSPPRTAGNDTHRSVECYNHTGYRFIYSLTWWNAIHRYALVSNAERRCVAKMRPA
jgi:hypothetical protein